VSVTSTVNIFNKHALDYDDWYKKHELVAEAEVRAVSALRVNGFGMEVGVGSGFFASKVGIPLGLEPALGMARLARDRGVMVVAGVGELMPVRDSSLNYVVVIVTICFLDDPRKTIHEIHRTLRPGGYLITCIVPRNSQHGKLYMELGKRGHKFYSAAHFYTVKELRELLEKIGFSIDDKAVAVLSRGVGDYYEEPQYVSLSEAENYGFTCIRAKKT
jgi:SAM-dependent methyltransferase